MFQNIFIIMFYLVFFDIRGKCRWHMNQNFYVGINIIQGIFLCFLCSPYILYFNESLNFKQLMIKIVDSWYMTCDPWETHSCVLNLPKSTVPVDAFFNMLPPLCHETASLNKCLWLKHCSVFIQTSTPLNVQRHLKLVYFLNVSNRYLNSFKIHVEENTSKYNRKEWSKVHKYVLHDALRSCSMDQTFQPIVNN